MALSPTLDKLQQEIAAELREVKGYAKLTGGPGVGKSTVLNTLPYPKLAPTNKAAAVIAGQTVHSFLGLKLKRFGGKEKLVPSPDTCVHEEKVIIDESSCLSTELLSEFILPYLPNVIFTGDEAQLPPVGEDGTPFLEIEGPHYHLDKVYRFGDDILDISHQFRRAILRRDLDTSIEIPDEWLSEGRADDEVAIAWTNRAVRSWQEDCDWYVGQKVRVGSFHNGLPTELETSIARIGDADISCDLPYRYITLAVGATVRVCLDQEALQAVLKQRADDKDWKGFWYVKDFFCDLRQGVSCTSHKSQGSTYPKVFADLVDIMSNRNQLEALRCAYVAITRAQHSVRCLL